MSENKGTEADPKATEQQGATPEPPQPEQKADDKLGEAGTRALQAERDARKEAEKRQRELQAQLDEIKKAQMSDLERAQAEAKAATEAAQKAQSEALRWRIAAKHGISDEDAETFLTGADEDTLTRQAERLASLASATPTTPKPDLSQGGNGATRPQTAAEKFAAAFQGRV